MSLSKINIAGNYEDLCEKTTQEILAFSDEKIARQGKFTIVLSGGATPKGIYQCMASPSYRDKFQWEKIHFFWGDERWVSPEDQKSNYRMVSETLLTKVKIPSHNIHPIPTQNGGPEDSASLYAETIGDFFKLKKGEAPHFDLILLGVGQDGHTASLFPRNPVLLVKDRLAAAVSQEGIAEQRITLTLPAINQADTIFFLASGIEKAHIVQEVLKDANRSILPANKIRPYQGRIFWFLDKAAASQLVNTSQFPLKRIGIACDHGGFRLKEQLVGILREADYEIIDFGDQELKPDDDYPDFVVPLARAVASAEVDRGIAICGSGVGACIAANKVSGVRACLIHDSFSACQGVEDDDMNVICLGSKVIDQTLAWELITVFLASRFSNADRHRRRLAKVAALENKGSKA